jgi:hypothetical protein
MTEVAEQFLIDILSPLLAPVPVRRDVTDQQIVRPIVIVAGRLDETYIPNARFSVAKIGLDVMLETQVDTTTDIDHEALISRVSASLPNYGQWTNPQSYYESVFFGPMVSQQKRTNDLVRSYVFGTYLVGKLTIPPP